MPKWQIAVWILIVALLSASIYAYGLKKAVGQKSHLMQKLYQKGSDKVMRYLKTHDSITKKQITMLIENINAGEFYSKNRAVITDKGKFTQALIEKMCQRGFIEQAGVNTYRRKK